MTTSIPTLTCTATFLHKLLQEQEDIEDTQPFRDYLVQHESELFMLLPKKDFDQLLQERSQMESILRQERMLLSHFTQTVGNTAPLPVSPPTQREIRNTLQSYTTQFQHHQQAINRAVALFREKQRLWPDQLDAVISTLLTFQTVTSECLKWFDEPGIRKFFHWEVTKPLLPLIAVKNGLMHLETEEAARLLLHLDAFREICRDASTKRINEHLSLRNRLSDFNEHVLQLIDSCIRLSQAGPDEGGPFLD